MQEGGYVRKPRKGAERAQCCRQHNRLTLQPHSDSSSCHRLTELERKSGLLTVQKVGLLDEGQTQESHGCPDKFEKQFKGSYSGSQSFDTDLSSARVLKDENTFKTQISLSAHGFVLEKGFCSVPCNALSKVW